MEYRAVAFDLFGTLVDNFSALEYRSMLQELAGIVGAPAEGFIRLWRETVDDRMTGAFPTVEAGIEHLCATLGVSSDRAKLAAAAEVRIAFTRRGLTPRHDAVETLTKLRGQGCKIGLVTNCTMEVPGLWEETPLALLVDEAVFSCVARVQKPNPRIYQMVCERLLVRADECLYVGDGANRELSAAARVGMHAVLLRVADDNPSEWERAEAEEWKGPTVSALREILTLVE